MPITTRKQSLGRSGARWHEYPRHTMTDTGRRRNLWGNHNNRVSPLNNGSVGSGGAFVEDDLQQQQHQGGGQMSPSIIAYNSNSSGTSSSRQQYYPSPQQQLQKASYNNNSTSWVIPCTTEEEVKSLTTPPFAGSSSRRGGVLASVTPDHDMETPARSNVRTYQPDQQGNNHTSLSSSATPPTSNSTTATTTTLKRSLHNSHRKTRLHHITPAYSVAARNRQRGDIKNNHPLILRYSDEVEEISHPRDDSNSSSQQLQEQEQSPSLQYRRGNGLVLDLTSLFSGDNSSSSITPKAATTSAIISPSPSTTTETATTAASTQQQQLNHMHNNNLAINTNTTPTTPPTKNKNYAAPLPPPWRTRTAAAVAGTTTAIAPTKTPTSPMTIHTSQTADDDNNTNNGFYNLYQTYSLDKSDVEFQWDTKSLTTQEALLTERQCQALTQWLNFTLMEDEEQHHSQMQHHDPCFDTPPSSPLNDDSNKNSNNSTNSKQKRSHASSSSRRQQQSPGQSFDSLEEEFNDNNDNGTIASSSTRATTATPGGGGGGGRTRTTTPTPGLGGRSTSSVRSRTTTTPSTHGRSTTPVTSFSTTTSMNGRSVTPTPPKQQQQQPPRSRTTPTSSSSSKPRSGTPTSSPSKRMTPLHSSTATKQQQHQQRYSRRRSMFQYAQSYDHALEQAQHWFHHSAQWKELRLRIRCEITAGKLTLREDRNLAANVACREQLLNLFLSYRPAWLTLALEVVMNETLILPSTTITSTNTTPSANSTPSTTTSTTTPAAKASGAHHQHPSPPQNNHHLHLSSSSSLPSTKQLKQFILQRVLSDERLLFKYTQGRGSRLPSGHFEELYLAELRPLVLYRILVLIFFLDRAADRYRSCLGNLFHATLTTSGGSSPKNKRNQINKTTPNNNNNSTAVKVKTTAQVLVFICREFLSKQGDIIKQLARANLPVYYKQERLDEIEFPIVNFAIDLRDGVRLCRLIELLWLLPQNNSDNKDNQNNNNNIENVSSVARFPLLSQLRIPAISRLQKIHNVNVALVALQEECQIGLPQDMQAHHIVDGQRRMVMRLIWTIVLMHCFDNNNNKLLTQRQVEEEIASLQGLQEHFDRMRERQRRRQQRQEQINTSLHLLEQETEGLAMISVHDSHGGSLAGNSNKTGGTTTGRNQNRKHHHRFASITPTISYSRSSSFDADDTFSCNSNALLEELGVVQQWKGLLWRWCQQVCTLVEAKERDDSVDAGSEATHLLNNTTAGNWTSSSDLANGKALCCLIHHYHPTLLPREELRLLSAVVDGPPTRIVTSQETTTPPLRNRLRHARLQRHKPKIAPDYHLRLAHRRLSDLGGIPPMMLMPLTTPGKYYQQTPLAPLAEEKSILVFLYHVCARLLESRDQVQAAVYVQQRYRYLRWLSLQKQKQSASRVIWKYWQVYKDNYFRARSQKYGASVQIIEAFTIRFFDKLRQLQEKRVERELQNLAVTPIQARVRSFLARKQYYFMLEQHYAALIIQSKFRQFQDYLSYQILLLDTIPAVKVVQRHWRGYVQRREYASAICAVIEIQAFMRGAVLVRKVLVGSQHNAATCIQRTWRGFWSQLQYQIDLMDIVAVQCWVRKQQAMQLAKAKAGAVAVLQHRARGFVLRVAFVTMLRQRNAAITIQKFSRRYVAIREWRVRIALVRATLVVQRSWRKTLFLRERRSASTKIQTRSRLLTARRKFVILCLATKIVQTQWRSYRGQKDYLRTRNMVMLLQRSLRRWYYGIVKVLRRKVALQTLQNFARRWLALRAFEARRKYRMQLIEKAIVCQALRRGNVCSRRWIRMRRVVLAIQRKWRSSWWVRYTTRKWMLLSALLDCNLLFRQSQKVAFKIVPHTRRVELFNKQALLRCGRKRIVLSNAGTWVSPWRSHRPNLFRHRYHIIAMRCKYKSAVRLENLPRRKIGLRTLRQMNQSSIALQVPWWYPYTCTVNPARTGKEAISCNLAKRRMSRARKLSASAMQSLVKRSAEAEEAPSHLSYQGAVKRVHAMEAAAASHFTFQKQKSQNLRVARIINLVRRSTGLPPAKKRGSDKAVKTYAFLDPWKLKHQMNVAALTIQKLWRGVTAVKKYRQSLRKVVTVQAMVRRFLAKGFAKKLTEERLQTSALTMQSCWRGYSARATFKSIIRSTLTVQSLYRCLVAKQAFKRKKAAPRIQQATRLWLARRKLSELRASREEWLQRSALTIQHHWRGYSARATFKSIICSTLSVQSLCRRLVAKRAFKRKKAVLRIQQATRLWLARKKLSELRALREEWLQRSVLTIQQYWRGYSARATFKNTIRSVLAVQSFCRCLIAKQAFRRTKAATPCIQQATRLWLARRKLRAASEEWLQRSALTIQHCWRGYSARAAFKNTICGVLAVQSFCRCLVAKQALKRAKAATTHIQQASRLWLARRKLSKLRAARELQQNSLAISVAALTVLQSRMRGHLVREQLRWEQQAAVSIQKEWRGFRCCAEFKSTLLCLIRIQSWWRALLHQDSYERTLLATVALQSLSRGLNAKMLLYRKRSSAIVIQSYIRAVRAQAILHKHRAASMSIQRCIRGFLTRQQISLEHFAATEIQKTWRCYSYAVGYIIVVVSAIKVQSFLRMALGKNRRFERYWQIVMPHVCATKIQCQWRMKQGKSELRMLLNAAVKIQSHMRKTLVQRFIRNERERERKRRFTKLEHGQGLSWVVEMQSIVRMFIAARRKKRLLTKAKLQEPLSEDDTATNGDESDWSSHQSTQESTEECMFHHRISLSQGMIRGFLTRRHSNPEIRRSVHLIQEANLRSKLDPSMRLGARMDEALKLLKATTSLTEIMNIVCTLELATRFSRECCEEFVLADATEILVDLLTDCNKSLPHVELLYYIMCTMSNVSKHPSLIDGIATLDAAKAFVYLIRMYGSEDAIFCSAVSLLELCALQNTEVKALLAVPSCRKRLELIYNQWERKVHNRIAKQAPLEVFQTPQFLLSRSPSKARTDMLILGVAYDLHKGVSTFERVLSRSAATATKKTNGVKH